MSQKQIIICSWRLCALARAILMLMGGHPSMTQRLLRYAVEGVGGSGQTSLVLREIEPAARRGGTPQLMLFASLGSFRVSRGLTPGVAEIVRGSPPGVGIRFRRRAFNAWALKFWEWRSLNRLSGSHLPHTHHPGAIRSAFLLRLTRLQAPLVGGYFFAR